jgi:hypothetical protein
VVFEILAIPVSTGAAGSVTSGLKIVETIPEKHSTDSLQKENSCTRDIARNKASAAMGNLETEWWGAPLVQEEKYQGKGDLW